MIVKSVSGHLPEGMGFPLNPITLGPVQFQKLNLIVGKNASGKTRTINLLGFLSRLFTSQRHGFIGNYSIELVDKGITYKYSCEGDLDSMKETLYRDQQKLIERSSKAALIYSEIKKGMEDVNPPEGISILQSRRDEKAYPYIEDIVRWAEGVFSYRFGHVHPTSFRGVKDDEMLTGIKDFNTVIGEMSQGDKEKVISEFNSLGYQVEILEFRKENSQYVLYIKEQGLEHSIHQSGLSQGMFRTLSILIYINHLVNKKSTSLIVIDDLCEGLDYDRASLLGKLIFNKMEGLDVQLVVTSNDSFLMNVIDIKYWNVILRECNIIKSFNYDNSKFKFDEFKFTGLNNFQLFASNYLN